MKTLSITRWGLGGPETLPHLFEDEAVLSVLDGGNIVVDASAEEDAETLAFFGGVAEAKWLIGEDA